MVKTESKLCVYTRVSKLHTHTLVWVGWIAGLWGAYPGVLSDTPTECVTIVPSLKQNTRHHVNHALSGICAWIQTWYHLHLRATLFHNLYHRTARGMSSLKTSTFSSYVWVLMCFISLQFMQPNAGNAEVQVDHHEDLQSTCFTGEVCQCVCIVTIYVAVPGRNWTLFNCIFRALYCIWSAVVHNFHYLIAQGNDLHVAVWAAQKLPIISVVKSKGQT